MCEFKKNEITIIVCTRNRVQILFECLDSIIQAIKVNPEVSLMVVDNGSTDITPQILKEDRYSMIESTSEPTIGLSHARNRGAKEAKGEWLCYIDDDGRLHPGYLERAKTVIKNHDFDCFGGMYYAWYPYGKPKWVDKNFGTKIPLRETVGPIDVSELSGGNFLIKKEVLESAGGFPIDFGMTGDKIGYGEEGFLQKRVLEMGYKLGFDPELKIDHALLPHKLKLSWHLKSWYARGRDSQRFSKHFRFGQIAFYFFRSFVGAFLKLPLCVGKLILNKDYYWQNLVWDVISPVFYRVGQLVACFR